MSSSNCCFLTCIQVSQEAGQVVWYSHLLKNFPQFVVIHTVKDFGLVNKAKVDVFQELSCFFDDPADVGNLISGSSAFSKSSLNIRKFTIQVLLKPGLENFEHHFASVWDECTCAVVWTFFGKTSINSGGSDGRVSVCNVGAPDSIPASGRSPGGDGNPFQSSCLENSMDGGAWWATQSVGWQRVGHDWATSLALFLKGVYAAGASGRWRPGIGKRLLRASTAIKQLKLGFPFLLLGFHVVSTSCHEEDDTWYSPWMRQDPDTYGAITGWTHKASVAHSPSRVGLSETPWTEARQAPLSMEFSRQGNWSGLPFLTPGDLLDPGIEPASLVSPALAGGFLTAEPPGTPISTNYILNKGRHSSTLNWPKCPYSARSLQLPFPHGDPYQSNSSALSSLRNMH